MRLLTITTLFVAFFNSDAFGAVDQLYIKSLSRSKQVEVFNLTEKASLSNFEARKSTLFPSLDLISSNSYGNNAVNNFSDENEIDTQVAVSLEQAVFQGGAEFAINDLNKVVPKQAKALKEASLAEYYSQFTTLYFKVSSAVEENEKIESLLNNLAKRVSLVKKRTRIGRDRKADLYALESQLHRLRAELATSKANLKAARTDFLNFSGLNSIEITTDEIKPASLELSKSVDLQKRPEIKNLQYQYESSLLEQKIEKSSYYPQVGLQANYFLDKSSLGRNDWEVSLNIRMNLLDFGQRSSNVETKALQARISKARLEFNRLNATRQWDNFIDSFNAKKRELASLTTALNRIRASYQEQLKDIQKGLVTQIEVIRSLDDVINLEKLKIRSALEVKSLYYQAKAYLGELPKR